MKKMRKYNSSLSTLCFLLLLPCLSLVIPMLHTSINIQIYAILKEQYLLPNC